MTNWNTVDAWLSGAVERMVAFQSELVRVPAIAPESGGDGEYLKARLLERLLQDLGWQQIRDYPAPDERVSHRRRPNLVYKRPGADHDFTVWIMAHTDVVPAGDRTKWDSEPFELIRKQDMIVGRGVEDNHQGLTAGVFALQALAECGVVSAHDVGMMFVADEECGSKYGIQYLLREHGDLFGPRDCVLVPDSGNSDGTMIEVAEKSILWLKFTTTGKQCHASRPYNGINAFSAASELVVALSRLPEIWPQRDPLFDPPQSTFQPTRKESNVPNINTIPGTDVFYMDSRIMPGIPLEDVIAWCRARADEVAARHGVSIAIEPVQFEPAAPPTPADCPLVRCLQQAIRDVHRREAKAMGIGGGTVAAYFRRHGLHAAVWSTVDESAHQANEYCRLPNLLADARIFARVLAGL